MLGVMLASSTNIRPVHKASEVNGFPGSKLNACLVSAVHSGTILHSGDLTD